MQMVEAKQISDAELADSLERISEAARQVAHSIRHYKDAPIACGSNYDRHTSELAAEIAKVSRFLPGITFDTNVHPDAVEYVPHFTPG